MCIYTQSLPYGVQAVYFLQLKRYTWRKSIHIYIYIYSCCPQVTLGLLGASWPPPSGAPWVPPVSRRHVPLFTKEACPPAMEPEDALSCGAKRHVSLLNEMTCLPVQQEETICLVVEQEGMSSCRTGRHISWSTGRYVFLLTSFLETREHIS